MSLPKKCIVDTNVPITANQALSPDDIPPGFEGCVQACVDAIDLVIKRKSLILDAGDEIFDEYKRNLRLKGQPGVGYKFPSTPHLARLTGTDVRDDKVLSIFERDKFLSHEIIIEEKVDGANLGISFNSNGNIQAQNRGEYLNVPGSGQWKKLSGWLSKRENLLFDNLTNEYILFGEWCYAQHSIYYDRLPDWFLGFDVFDKQSRRFLSVERRDAIFKKMQISQVPMIARGLFLYEELETLLMKSKITDQPSEGLYLRIEENGWLFERAKLVRPAFIQFMEQHWTSSVLKTNRLMLEVRG